MTSMDCFPCCGTHKKQDKKSLKKDDSDRIGQSPIGSAADIARLRSGELRFAPVCLAPACDLIIIFFTRRRYLCKRFVAFVNCEGGFGEDQRKEWGRIMRIRSFLRMRKLRCWSVCWVASLYNVVPPFTCRSCHLS